ncbi:MAG: choice-of-anchor D domain-containing protein [Bacteroidetes bacterium]|jgi:hypothetical protein|nr:choice-of-anchor D domain-containing protein [Bacteroidota bacterium]
MKRKLLLLIFALISFNWIHGQTICYPDNANYNTGSTNGVTFTETSEVYTESNNVSRGWVRFNTSAIPDGDTILSAELHIYIAEANYARFRVTPMENDPLSGNAASVFADAGGSYETAYRQETSEPQSQEYYVGDLGPTAAADLKNLISNDWFSVGLYAYDDYIGDYLSFDGWGEENKPYLVVTHAAPASCPLPTALTESNITTTSAQLGWASGGASNWDIEWGPMGFTPGEGTVINGTADNPYTLTGLTAGESYDWYIRDNCGGVQVSWAGPSSFTTLPGAQAFPLTEDFESGLTYFDNATYNDVNWTLNTSIYHSNTKSAHNAYGSNNTNILHETGILDLSGTSAAVLEFWHIAKTEAVNDKCFVEISTDGGASYTALPTESYLGSGSGYATAGYFDENHFTVWGTGSETPDNTWWRKETFDLADYATTDVRFRFKLRSSTGTHKSGWYIDDIHIHEPSCPAPTYLISDNETSSGAELSWTDNTGAFWDIYIVPSGSAAPDASATPTVNDHSSLSYSWTGGIDRTTYDWYVRSDCGQNNTDVSTWSGPNSFTTKQNPAPVQSLPFSENWESGSISQSWNFATGSVALIEANTSSNYTGTYGLEQYGDSYSGYTDPTSLADAYAKAIPGGANENWTSWNKMSVDLSAATNPSLIFWYAMGYQYQGNYNSFWVQVSTDNNTWTDLFSIQTSWQTIVFEQKEIDLSAYSGTNQLYIRFFHNGKYATNYLYLDDISIDSRPCPTPTTLDETNIGVSSVDLGWTEIGTGTTWNIKWGAQGFDPDTEGQTISGVTTNPYTLSGLAPNNNYDWYVQTDCEGSDESLWAGPGTFTTIDGKATNPTPASGATDIAVTSTILDWDDVVGATGYKITIGTSPGGNDVAIDVDCATSDYTYGSDWDYNTVYYWKVKTVYPGGTIMGDEWDFATECDIYPTPFSENFNGTYTPICWFEAFGDVPVPSQTSSAWDESSNFANVTGNSKAIKMNVYSGDNDWLISPEIDLGAGNKRITYKVAATDYNGTNAVSMGEEENVYVLIKQASETWDLANALADYTAGNTPSNTGDEISIALSGWSGVVNFAFYTKGSGSSPDMDIHFDDFIIEEMPATPEFAVTPESKDYGTVDVTELSSQTFSISNTGSGTLGITGVALSGTNADQFTIADLNSYPTGLGTGESISVEVSFEPTSAGPKTASLVISDDQGGGDHTVNLTGVGYVQPQGNVCSNPIPLTLPATDITGNTIDYGDDYSSTDIDPSSSYLSGDDVVYQFTLPNGGLLEGTITTTEDWIGAFVLADCPNATTPPTPVIQKTSSDQTLTYSNDIAAGTYFLIISSYPSPQSIDYTINLSLSEYPASSTWTGNVNNDWHTAGNWDNEVPGFTTNATIPAGLTNYPTISSAASCHDITLQSTASGTASLLGNSFLTVNGTATIERYVTGGQIPDSDPAKYKYHMLSIPLASDIQAGEVFTGTYLWKFVPNQTPDNSWTGISSFTEDLDNQKGFLSYVETTDKTFSFNGNMNYGSFSVATETISAGNVKLIPNPYPSAIDWETVDLSGTGLNPTIWFFNSETGNYDSYNAGAGDGQQYIPVGQAVFVEAESANPTLSYTNANRTHSQGNGFYKSGNENLKDILKIAVSANNSADATFIRFRELADNNYNGFDDASKLRGFAGSPQLYTQSADEIALSINTLATSQETVIVPLAYELEVAGEAQLSFEYLETFDPAVTIFLEDTHLDKMIDLREQSNYSFEHLLENDPLRFKLHFIGVTSVEEQQLSAYQIWSYDSKVYVSIPALTGDKAVIELIDAQGKVVYEGEHHLSNPEILAVHTNQQLLIARIITGTQVYTQKVFIR